MCHNPQKIRVFCFFFAKKKLFLCAKRGPHRKVRALFIAPHTQAIVRCGKKMSASSCKARRRAQIM
jgi:hypothetical protein